MFFGGDLQVNKIFKSLKALKGLNLIIVKTDNLNREALELHPLIRTFLRKKFPREEQAPIMSMVMKFFNAIIGKFSNSKDTQPEFVLDYWIAKIELCLQNSLFSDALECLYEINDAFFAAGYEEEFVRLSEYIVKNHLPDGDPREWKRFDTIAGRFVSTLGELGRYDEVDDWIGFLATTVEGKSARHIWMCSVKSNAYWLMGVFINAIRWASEGVDMKKKSHVDTSYDCEQDLALAQRDFGLMEPTLQVFLAGNKLEDILSDRHYAADLRGSFYGNIGRCLQLIGSFNDALICLRKSARLLEEKRPASVRMNRGWAAQWIGDVLKELNLIDLSYCAYRRASGIWRTCSPKRSQESEVAANDLSEFVIDKSILLCGDWECEQIYLNWLMKGSASLNKNGVIES